MYHIATIGVEHLASLLLHLAREHHRGRRLRRMGTGNAYIAATAKLIRDLLAKSGWPKAELLHFLKIAFKEAASES